MIEGLKPYAEYKESGLPWLGRIPSGRDLRRGKILYREVDERSKTGKEELLSVSHKTGVTPRSQKNVTMFLAASNVGHKICRSNDLVINTLWAWMAALGVTQHTGVVSPAYGVYRPSCPDRLLPKFADLVLRTPIYAAEYLRRSTGVNSSRLRLYPEDFLRIPVLMPNTNEQAAIVRFLDHANRKIDGFIRAKRKLIGLLNEQKQAIIHIAIAKVSTPDCRSMPVRAVLRPVKRMGFPDKTLLSLFRDYGVIPKDSRENKNVDVRDLALCQLVNSGDVVMNKMKAWQGSIAVSGLEGIVSPDYMVLEFQIKPIVEDFFHYALRSPIMVGNYRKQSYGVRPGQWRLM